MHSSPIYFMERGSSLGVSILGAVVISFFANSAAIFWSPAIIKGKKSSCNHWKKCFWNIVSKIRNQFISNLSNLFDSATKTCHLKIGRKIIWWLPVVFNFLERPRHLKSVCEQVVQTKYWLDAIAINCQEPNRVFILPTFVERINERNLHFQLLLIHQGGKYRGTLICWWIFAIYIVYTFCHVYPLVPISHFTCRCTNRPPTR